MKMVFIVHFKCITSNTCTFTHSIWVRERQRVVGRREECIFCILTPESLWGICNDYLCFKNEETEAQSCELTCTGHIANIG